MLVAAVPTQAATVTLVSDVLSTQEASEASDHLLLFTTPSGVSEGENISITFSSAFDTSTVT